MKIKHVALTFLEQAFKGYAMQNSKQYPMSLEINCINKLTRRNYGKYYFYPVAAAGLRKTVTFLGRSPICIFTSPNFEKHA